MNKVRGKLFSLAATVCVVIVLITATSVIAQEKYVLKLGTIAAPQHIGSYPQNVKFAELVKAKTKGKVEIQVIGSSQLGDERKLAESLQIGTLDFAGVTVIVLANWEKGLEIFGLPYTFNSFRSMLLAQYTVGPEQAENLRKKAGIRILTFITGNYRQFFTNKPIRNINDMKGLKLRSMENPVYITLFKALGTNPTPMGFGEMFTALKSGVVDGFDLPAWVVPLSGMQDAVKYCAVTNHVITPFTISVSEKVFQKFPADIQKAMIEAAKETALWHDERIQEIEKNSLKDLAKYKITVTYPDLAPFQSVGRKIVDDWAAKNNMVNVVNTMRKIDAGAPTGEGK